MCFPLSTSPNRLPKVCKGIRLRCLKEKRTETLNRSAVAACGLETKNGESATGTGDASCDRRIPFVPAAEIPFP